MGGGRPPSLKLIEKALKTLANLHSSSRNPHAFAFSKHGFTEASNGLPPSELKIPEAWAIQTTFIRLRSEILRFV